MKERQLNLLHLPLFTVLEYAREYAENTLQDYLVQRVITSPRMPCSLVKNSYVPFHTIGDGISCTLTFSLSSQFVFFKTLPKLPIVLTTIGNFLFLLTIVFVEDEYVVVYPRVLNGRVQ
jgi:hypothetical protein